MDASTASLLFSTPLATVSGSPVGATLRLAALVRGGARAVTMEVDPAVDRALEDPRAETQRALGDARLLGPAAAGVRQGAGAIGLVTALGEPAKDLWDALGEALGIGIDLGLAWDLSPGEALGALVAAGTCDRIGLFLPDLAKGGAFGLAQALRAATGKVAVLVMTHLGQPGIPVLKSLGAAVYDLRSGPALLIAALRLPPPTYPRGRRVAVISDTGPLGAEAATLLTAFGLELARPAEPTIARLESELPLKTTFGGHLRIPGPTERHLAVARATLAADPGVDHVVTLGLAGTTSDPLALLSGHGPLAVLAPLAELGRRAALPSMPASPPVDAVAEPTLLRAHALLSAALIMRRRELAGDEASTLLANLEAGLTALPSIPVASLAAARAAARRVGYPVSLDRDGPALADEAALDAAWEGLLGDLRRDPSDEPRDPRWDPRWVSRVAPIVVDYSARPLPVITFRAATHGPRLLALPLDPRDLGASNAPGHDADGVHATLAPLFRALERVAASLPEVARAEVRATETGAITTARLELEAFPGGAIRR